MKLTPVIRIASAALLAVGIAGLTACASTSSSSEETAIGGNVVAPVTMEANDLQGATVELVVGQVLNIKTGSLAVDSFTGEISDEKVAEYTQGKEDGGAVFNPGVTALSEGETEVTLTNAQGGIQPVTFTVEVTK